MSTLFDGILSITAEITSVDPKSIRLSSGCVKRWQSLAEFWDSRPDVFEDVIYKAMMNVITGNYPKGSDKSDKLIELIQEALTTEKDVLKNWWRLDNFSKAMRKVKKYYTKTEKVNCETISEFIRGSLEFNIFYRKVVENWDLTDASKSEKERVRSMKRINKHCEDFKQVIQFFISDANAWTYDEWMSENYILDAFENVYGIDYSQNTKSFDKLIEMIGVRMKLKTFWGEELHKLFYIEEMNDSIAKLLWPIDMEKEFVNCFERILTVKIFSVEYYPNKDAVMNSWVYKKLMQLAEEKNPAITSEVGKKLFEFGLGIDG